jgi:predicted ATPase
MAGKSRRGSHKLKGPFLKRIAALAERVDASRYPFNLPVFAHGIDIEITSNVTFFVGENGSGKSTLLEAIAESCGFNAEGGSRDHNFAEHGDRSDLGPALRLSWLPKVTDGFFMRAESFYHFATYLERVGSRFGRYGGRPLHDMSHGESFLPLFANRFDREFTSSMNPKRRFRPNVSSAF